jgi:hypothetical protein
MRPPTRSMPVRNTELDVSPDYVPGRVALCQCVTTSDEANRWFPELSLELSVVQTESVNINIRMPEVILIISHCRDSAYKYLRFCSQQRLNYINGVFVDVIQEALIRKPVCLQAPPVTSCFKQQCVDRANEWGGLRLHLELCWKECWIVRMFHVKKINYVHVYIICLITCDTVCCAAKLVSNGNWIKQKHNTCLKTSLVRFRK